MAASFTYLTIWHDLLSYQLFNQYWFVVLMAAPIVWVSWCFVRWG